MNIEKYLNGTSCVDNEIRNYQAEARFLKEKQQEIKQSNLLIEEKENKSKEIITRLNEIAATINQFQIEKDQLMQQAFANHLLEINYGSLVKELQTIAEKRKASVGFSHCAVANKFRIGINIISPKDGAKNYNIFIPFGKDPQSTFSELMKMEYSKVKINFDPRAYYMENSIICEAVHNCVKRKAKIAKNIREK